MEQDKWNANTALPEYRQEDHSAPVIQKKEEDSLCATSQIAACTERTVCLPPHPADTW